MKKFFIITVILLIQSFPVFGSVDGKGIVCKCLDCKLEHLDLHPLCQIIYQQKLDFILKLIK